MTAVHEVSALLDAIDREARDSLPAGCTVDALRYLVEAIDRLMTEPLEPTEAMVEAWLSQMDPWLDALDEHRIIGNPARMTLRAVLPVAVEAIAARMLPAVQRAAEALGVEP